MIYTAPCVIVLMRADTLLGEVDGSARIKTITRGAVYHKLAPLPQSND
jgi:hypothetical protein